jgi:hypothetical protein
MVTLFIWCLCSSTFFKQYHKKIHQLGTSYFIVLTIVSFDLFWKYWQTCLLIPFLFDLCGFIFMCIPRLWSIARHVWWYPFSRDDDTLKAVGYINLRKLISHISLSQLEFVCTWKSYLMWFRSDNTSNENIVEVQMLIRLIGNCEYSGYLHFSLLRNYRSFRSKKKLRINLVKNNFIRKIYKYIN